MKEGGKQRAGHGKGTCRDRHTPPSSRVSTRTSSLTHLSCSFLRWRTGSGFAIGRRTGRTPRRAAQRVQAVALRRRGVSDARRKHSTGWTAARGVQVGRTKTHGARAICARGSHRTRQSRQATPIACSSGAGGSRPERQDAARKRRGAACGICASAAITTARQQAIRARRRPTSRLCRAASSQRPGRNTAQWEPQKVVGAGYQQEVRAALST